MPGGRDDPHAVLGLERGASAVEIRRRYRELARAHHPDVLSGAPESVRTASAARMAELNSAFRALRANRTPEPAPVGAPAASEPGAAVVSGGAAGSELSLSGVAPLGPWAVLPAVLAAAAVLCVGLAWLLRTAALLGGAIAFGVLAAVAFVLTPMVVMSGARRRR